MQKKTIVRTTIAGAAVAAAAATAAISATAAGADPGDPVQNATGYTTISFPQGTMLGVLIKEGVTAVPLSVASIGTNPSSMATDVNFRVSGGDGSAPQLYGTVKNAGALTIVDARTKKSVTISNPAFSFDTGQVTFTEPDGVTSVALLDTAGVGEFGGVGGGNQFYSNSNMLLDQAGAAYLDSVLGTRAFRAGQSVGSFYTNFTNNQY